MKPLSNHIIAKHLPYRIPQGGILIPEAAQETMMQGDTKVYEVLAVGPGKLNAKGRRIPIECQPGDRIISKVYGSGPELLSDGNYIMTDDMIMAVVPRI